MLMVLFVEFAIAVLKAVRDEAAEFLYDTHLLRASYDDCSCVFCVEAEADFEAEGGDKPLAASCKCAWVFTADGRLLEHARASHPSCEGSVRIREALDAIEANMPAEVGVEEEPRGRRGTRATWTLAHSLVGGVPAKDPTPNVDATLLTADWFTGFIPAEVRVPEVDVLETEKVQRFRLPIGASYYETVELKRPGAFGPKRVEITFERQTTSGEDPYVAWVDEDIRPRVTVAQRAQDEATLEWLRRDEYELWRESKRRRDQGGSVEGDRTAPGLAGEREWLGTQLRKVERDFKAGEVQRAEAQRHAKALRARFNTRRFVEALGGDPDSPEFVAWRKKQPMSYATLNEVLAAKVEERFLALELATLAVPGLISESPKSRAPQFARPKMTSIATEA